MSTRYAVAVLRIKDVERSQDPAEQLLWAANEMASILKEGDPAVIDLPIAWAGLAMVHRAQHEISAGFETLEKELTESKERAQCSLKQVSASFYYFPFLFTIVLLDSSFLVKVIFLFDFIHILFGILIFSFERVVALMKT